MPPPRWLLLSDIHFRQRDFERTRRTAEWIVSLARSTPGLSRVVVCGDVLTSRSMQPTAVLSAAYRFLSELSTSVPHVNVILGNHDLAYRRDYGTTALEALSMTRLRPFVSLHDEVAKYEWDGRRVLVLPFREDQSELTDAVAALPPAEAAETVAFAHLALNRAVTQRHLVRSDVGKLGYSVRYKGLTGPDHFGPLARTFTGHFHSHQTIFQPGSPQGQDGAGDPLKGSVTYLGAPLQLTWADLYDENRGVVLLNPKTLEHELVPNPHAVGYVTVQGAEVLEDRVDTSAVQGKHVMILGTLSRFRHWSARDKLLSLGAQSVREPQAAPTLGAASFTYNGLGASVPASDRDIAFKSDESNDLPGEAPSELPIEQQISSPEPDEAQMTDIDPVEHVREYVESLEVGSGKEQLLVRLGERLIMESEFTGTPEWEVPDFTAFLDPSYSLGPKDASSTSPKPVFVAKPRSLAISNFLGIQDECTIDFDGELGRGLTFVVGSNGSGKSTLIEAIVWCQFGRCIRRGLAVGDVVNDVVGKDCMVSLSFSNGYTITRYRKHRVNGNRVIVSLNGVEQQHFEHGESRATQAAIDDLLGIDYEEFIKTVVLGHESAASFLSSTPAQRHDLIASTLRLSRLDKAADLASDMISDIQSEINDLDRQIEDSEETMRWYQQVIDVRTDEVKQLQTEYEKARSAFGPDSSFDHKGKDTSAYKVEKFSNSDESILSGPSADLQAKIRESRKEVELAQNLVQEVEIWEEVDALQSEVDKRISEQQKGLQEWKGRLEQLVNPSNPREERMRPLRTALSTLANTITSLDQHVTGAMGQLGKEDIKTRAALHFVRIGLMTLKKLSTQLNELSEQLSPSTSESTRPAQVRDIETAKYEIGFREARLAQLAKEKDEVLVQVQDRRQIKDPLLIDSIMWKLTDTDLKDARSNLSTALSRLSSLLEEQGALHKQEAQQHQRDRAKALSLSEDELKKRASLLHDLGRKDQEIKTLRKTIQKDTEFAAQLREEQADAQRQIDELEAKRELYDFWDSALSRRRTRSLSGAKTKSDKADKAKAPTFRGYVLDKSLEELNAAASRILLVLYEDTRHARELTRGMLRTILADDTLPSSSSSSSFSPEEDEESSSESSSSTSSSSSSPEKTTTTTTPTSPRLLDRTLGVTKSLSYAKRSGGERKRIDLAVFFALVHVAQAHSAHRARYMLVDEAFDSLDAPGQRAVVRWCSRLQSRTDFQLVVTHSDFLASGYGGGGGGGGGAPGEEEQGRKTGDGGEDEESRFSVLTASMTKEGTKFAYDAA